MHPYFWYILKVIICSGILLSYYWLFLRNKAFNQYNRFYLLAALGLSLMLPLVKINFWQPSSSSNHAIRILQAVSTGDEYMDTIYITANKQNFGMEQLYLVIYWLVSILFVLIIVRTLFTIRTLLKKYPVKKIEEVYFLNTLDERTPFSFLKYVFWNANIDINSKTGEQIFKHEIVHVQQKHTYDKLFVNLLISFFWCNPFFWLYRKELYMIHEFIADKKSIKGSDTASFAAMLLQSAYPKQQFQLTNNFFYSPIKRRLKMLTKIDNPRVSYFTRLMVLPLAVLLFAAFTFKKNTKEHVYRGKKVIIVVDAGHGGSDNGAVGSDGTYEKDLTLAIAKKVKELNKNEDIDIVLTRDDDIYMTPKQKAEIAKIKNGNLFISIHIDGTPGVNQKNGMSFLVARDQFPNAQSSKILASALISEFSSQNGLLLNKVPQQRNNGIWILQANNIPSVLIEAGYITADKDLAYLKTNAGKESIAKNILAAIEKYLGNTNSNINIADTLPTKNDWRKASGNAYLKNGNNDSYTIVADTVYFNDQNKSTKLKGYNAKISGDLSNYLIYLQGKIVSPDQVSNIPPGEIKSITILNGDDIKNIAEAKGKNSVFYISLKENDVKELPGTGSLTITNPPATNHSEKIVNVTLSERKNSTTETQVILSDTVVKPIKQNDQDKIFTKVEINAQFTGGDTAWRTYLRRNLKFSIPVEEGWAAGKYTIIVRFIVHADGTVSDITTENYKGSKTANECIRVIKNSPKWQPAIQNGKKVNAYRYQPITYVIEE